MVNVGMPPAVFMWFDDHQPSVLRLDKDGRRYSTRQEMLILNC